MRIIIVFLFLLLSAGSSIAADFNGIKFLMISSADKAAVVRNANGELKLLKTGDTVGAETRIVAFEDDHVVLEGPGEWAPVKYLVEVREGQMKVTTLARRPVEKHQFVGGEVKSFKAKSQ